MPQLVTVTFPVIPTTVTQQRVKPVNFPPAPLFDFELGDFVTDAAGRIIMTDGYTAWKQWCIKTLMTQMAAYPIYPRMHGIDYGSVRNSRPRPVVESDLAQRIKYALTRTVRTVDVINFGFDWSTGEELQLQCTPVPAAGAPFVLPGHFPIAA